MCILTTNLICHMILAYFRDLAALTAGQIVAETTNFPITELVIDSRCKAITHHPIFFALIGVHHDGHDYLGEAYRQGIRQFVVQESYACFIRGNYTHANILAVPDTLVALQQFVASYRSQYHLPVLAITGSNGKTIVKEWMHAFLSTRYKTVSSPHSYNSQVGVPLSVSLLDTTYEYAVFEAGISTVGEMAKLALLIQPTHGLFTTLGPAHDQGFADLQQKMEEKAHLFATCSTIYYCKDHLLVDAVLQKQYGNQKVLKTWSLYHPLADYAVTCRPVPQEERMVLEIATSNRSHTFVAPFQDHASLENSIHCLVYLIDNGFEPEQLQRSLAQLKTLPMRIACKAGIHGCQLIDDSYTNDLASLRVALDLMHRYRQTKKTVVLSDFMQTGMPDAVLYKMVHEILKQHNIDRIIGIGAGIGRHAALFSMPKRAFFATVEQFMDHTPWFQNEVILVKGARPFRLERLVQALEKQTHGTVLEIDMQAIRHNLAYFKAQIATQTRIMVVVKAAAYGNGQNDFELVAALQRHGVACLGVAYADEGICLRQQGIALPIVVMNPTDACFDALIDHALEPVVYSLDVLEAVCALVQTRAVNQLPIHLKLETGMYRLGLEACDIDPLLQKLHHFPSLFVTSIFSHLVGAQDPVHDAYTHLQAETFQKLAHRIEQGLPNVPLKHLLNTNGILRFPQFQFDMVRLGIGLYGVGVAEEIRAQLLPASTLKTTISQVKRIPKGASIGYDRKAIAAQDSLLATLPIGYADGFSRAFGSGRGGVLIQGRYCPVVGTVCMDMCMVDVTGVEAKRGDEAIVFGPTHSIDALAASVGTISYELLAQLSPRIKRVYCS
ncbi:MAG TPA: bifunctional UDP-N-acetylmuramoyl-tripeptide:D-alanyl-D-alanine ligase/alanine racemase [Amoebophilaceae bacterium]|nr:bifunctional UDP-N-acetylmuramoyl-tripeptide:D-alanyl-D-alanine ligase/alanine racemase [Amoebophilaceae bacterium]